MIRKWLEIIPANEQTVVINENMTFETEAMQAKIWYRGDSSELSQFFGQISKYGGTTAFWASAPDNEKIRKIHSGLPAVIADTLSYIVSSDLDGIDVDCDIWADIEQKQDFESLVKKCVTDTLVCGDGAFKISVDRDVSEYPILEFVSGDNVEYEYKRGILTAVIFKSYYTIKSRRYTLFERYEKGLITSRLFDENEGQHPLDIVPQLKGINETTAFDGDYIMAVPLMFYRSGKYYGRGKSIFSGGKSDCFDALDEVISQWWDALRMGRVKQYIPESFIPRNPENGSLSSPDRFGNDYIMIEPPLTEGIDNQRIEVVQPDIKYEAFVNSYTHALLMCLQGVISPATLGIDVGKMSSAEAQREKKDVTGSTRNTITSALEKALPTLIDAVLKTYGNMQGEQPKEYNITVTFGEYGAPDFDSRVETIGKASAYKIMSIESQVNELWGSSKDDDWKAAEIERIKSQSGIESMNEPVFTEV